VAVILTDHLGSPIEVHDMSGALLWTWYADAFGTTLPDEDPGHSGKRFTLNVRLPGQYYDAESGLHYNGQRYYAPTIGRYISSDPIGLAGGSNTFAYVGGNPVGNFDADGLQVAIPPQLIIPGVPNPTAEAQKQLAERISEAFRRNSRTKTYQTYTRFNPRTGQCYTGRTSGYDDPETNVRNRGYGQAALNAEGFRPGVLDKSSENYAPIRGREQQVLEINGGAQSSGGTSRNKINGISPINPAGPYVYLPAALEEFGEPKPAALCTCK
jgi:RHS repeat-associated protein